LASWRLGVSIIAAVALSACAQREPAPPQRAPDPPPAWAEKLPSEPGMLFAAGSAEGREREAAVAAARSELASEIEVSVRAERAERQRDEVAADSTGKRVERYDSAVRAEAAQRVAQDRLPGVQVRETREAGGRTWALVAMDRAAWAEQLRTRLGEADAAMRPVIVRWTAAGDEPATAVRLWLQLVPMAAQRDEIADRLRVAAPAETSPPSAFDAASARLILSRALAQVGISVRAEPRELAGAATDACAGVGLRAIPAGGALSLVINAPPATAQRIGGEWRVDGSAVAELGVPGEARELALIRVAERASGLDEAAARGRLRDKLAAAIAADLDRNLLSYLARW
jgi:hypothetical protein